MGFKRQRLMDQGSSYYGNPPGPKAEIVDFFHDLDVVDVLFVHKGAKSTGEAYCVLGYPLQIDFALKRNRETIGRRYVEVFQSRKDDYYKAIANEVYDSQGGLFHRGVPKAGSFDDSKDLAEYTGILRLRGLPYTASKEDIMDFFRDFVLSESKIRMIVNSEGRPTGEAFVEFASAEDSKAAMSKDRMTLKYRYIELFPSSHEELEEAASSGRLLTKSFEGKDMGEPTTILRMRGLPFSAGKSDILDFFKNATLSEETIHITYNFDGRPTGEAFVEFANVDDAKAALAKDRMTLGSRYIELFPASLDELKEATSSER
ncbi:heterogeneous nuclear ribonucleo F [Olea europaea subsp. europaea]|uniref:Heterogeneous nuclear ribonucleo F n=1 Tax=Olea europaea subsp. europaea TaxID=158383 RepID=A0A8S0T0N1_OLEEU|nr:heterogeneous nuclear ribonucleo F [Olea europaea subsp. europaea]